MTIADGAISRDQQSVELKLQDGRTLHLANHGHFGFDGLHISPDHQTASWNVLWNLGNAHFIYPVSTGVEVWRPAARLDRIVYCDDAVLSHWWFWSGGREVVLDCGTAHGPPSEHHLLFDVASGRQLGEVRYDDRTRAPIGPEPGWSVLQTKMGMVLPPDRTPPQGCVACARSRLRRPCPAACRAADEKASRRGVTA